MHELNAYDDQYGTCEETFATLRMLGGTDDPGWISDRLRLEPTGMRMQGKSEFLLDGTWRRSNHANRVARQNGWSISTKGVVDSRDSRRHIDHLLALLREKGEEVVQLRDEGWKIEVVVYWVSKHGHGGPTLSPSTLRMLAELEITIWFDVYFAGGDSTSEEIEGQSGFLPVGF